MNHNNKWQWLACSCYRVARGSELRGLIKIKFTSLVGHTFKSFAKGRLIWLSMTLSFLTLLKSNINRLSFQPKAFHHIFLPTLAHRFFLSISLPSQWGEMLPLAGIDLLQRSWKDGETCCVPYPGSHATSGLNLDIPSYTGYSIQSELACG